MGVGSDPTPAWVLGGVFRSMSRFNEGTDISLSLRLTTGGFSRGDWGFGLNLGPGLRLWGNNGYGTYPLRGPSSSARRGGSRRPSARTSSTSRGTPRQWAFALIEFDLLRFTLMRRLDRPVLEEPLPCGGRAEPDGRPGER